MALVGAPTITHVTRYGPLLDVPRTHARRLIWALAGAATNIDKLGPWATFAEALMSGDSAPGSRAMAPTIRPPSESARIARLLGEETRTARLCGGDIRAGFRAGGRRVMRHRGRRVMLHGGKRVRFLRQMAGQGNGLGELFHLQRRP